MTFWDSSAVVLLLLEQPGTEQVVRRAEEDPELLVWWGTPVECGSAVARLRREGGIGVTEEAQVNAGRVAGSVDGDPAVGRAA